MKGLMIMVLAGLLLVTLVFQNADAASFKWKQTYYSHYADRDTLETVLQDLMYGEKIPVMVSKKIDAEVNVHLEGMPPEEAFDRLAKTYEFIWYYDNQALFVYDRSELMTATLKLEYISSDDFTYVIKDLGIYDDKYGWESAKDRNVIYFTGPPRLVNLVMEMAKVYDTKEPLQKRRVVYTWKDSRGVPNYSNKPPADRSVSFSMIDQETEEIVETK